MGCAGIKWGARDGRLGVGGCLTEMDRGLLGGACLEWGLSGWAGQPYGNMGERQAGALRLSRGGRGGEEEGRGVRLGKCGTSIRQILLQRSFLWYSNLGCFFFFNEWKLLCFPKGILFCQLSRLKGGNRNNVSSIKFNRNIDRVQQTHTAAVVQGFEKRSDAKWSGAF